MRKVRVQIIIQIALCKQVLDVSISGNTQIILKGQVEEIGLHFHSEFLNY